MPTLLKEIIEKRAVSVFLARIHNTEVSYKKSVLPFCSS